MLIKSACFSSGGWSFIHVAQPRLQQLVCLRIAQLRKLHIEFLLRLRIQPVQTLAVHLLARSGESPIRKSRNIGVCAWTAPGFSPIGGISTSLRRVSVAICCGVKNRNSAAATWSAASTCGIGVFEVRPNSHGTGAGGGEQG